MFRLASNGLSPSPSRVLSRRGWADPGWNWGSANGAAHDEAMALRSRLRSKARDPFARGAAKAALGRCEKVGISMPHKRGCPILQ